MSPSPFLTGKQLLPLSSSLHAGVSQLAWQGPSGGLGGPGATGGMSAGGGEVNNLVRMRSQALGQSAPSLTGLVSTQTLHNSLSACVHMGRVPFCVNVRTKCHFSMHSFMGKVEYSFQVLNGL